MNEQELNKKLADRNELGQFVAEHNVSESNKEILRKIMKGKVAKDARHWKEGKYKNSKGYIMVYSGIREGANKSGYTPEHRIVAESFLGRKLSKNEVIHHINGIRDDNVPENLWVYDRREHRRVHNEDAFAVLAYFYNLGKVGFNDGRYFIIENKT